MHPCRQVCRPAPPRSGGLDRSLLLIPLESEAYVHALSGSSPMPMLQQEIKKTSTKVNVSIIWRSDTSALLFYTAAKDRVK